MRGPCPIGPKGDAVRRRVVPREVRGEQSREHAETERAEPSLRAAYVDLFNLHQRRTLVSLGARLGA